MGSYESRGMSVCNVARKQKSMSVPIRPRFNSTVRLIEGNVVVTPVVTVDSNVVEVIALSLDRSTLSCTKCTLDKGKQKVLDCDSFESDLEDPFTLGPIAAKKTKRSYEASRRFQETWALQMSWAEMHKRVDGLIQSIRCVVCPSIDGN